MAGAGVREGCENVGRRGGFGEGPKGWFSRGRRRDFGLCEIDVCVAVTGARMPRLNFFVAGGNTFEASALKSLKRNSEVNSLVHMSFFKEILRKRFAF